MEFDKKYIGRLLLEKDDFYIICGYDYLQEKYLIRSLRGKFNSCQAINDNYKLDEKALDYDSMIKSYEEKILDLRLIDEIVSTRRDELPFDEVDKIFRRIEGCYTNIKLLKHYIERSAYEKQKELYEKEIKNNSKGLKRALKRLYSTFNEDEYYTIFEFLEKNEFSILYLKTKAANYTQRKNSLEDDYNKFIKNNGISI